MECIEKHTPYQPTDDEFKCPKCGKGPNDDPQGLIVDEVPESVEGTDCGKLHCLDLVRCYACGHETSGRSFAAYLMKKKLLVPCPCCKGKGTVPGKEKAKTNG